MTTLGIDITDKDKMNGWEVIGQSGHRPVHPLLEASIRAYRLASHMVDNISDNHDIQEMLKLAKDLEDIYRSGEECGCVLPEQSCRVCRAMARLTYSIDS